MLEKNTIFNNGRYTTNIPTAHLRYTQCSILLHLIDICFLTCICLWQISQIQTCLRVVVGPGLISTSPAFMRSIASHPAGQHGRFAQKMVIGSPLLGSTQFSQGSPYRCDSSTACRLCRLEPLLVVVDLPLLRVAVEGSDNPISLEKRCQASLPPDQQGHHSFGRHPKVQYSVSFGPGLDSMSPARSRRSSSHAAGTHGWLPKKTGRPGLRRGGVGGYNLHSVPPDSGTPTTSRLYPFGAEPLLRSCHQTAAFHLSTHFLAFWLTFRRSSKVHGCAIMSIVTYAWWFQEPDQTRMSCLR